ncbi:MAG: CoA pyrophosphatase [Myxococcota bacterium]|nr:CoA pyrophosphatase [Myxococcota bacterium]
MLTLAHTRAALAQRTPETVSDKSLNRAAVALILRENHAGLEIFFIERSRREDDPWSGHMAFPGGRLEEVDADSRAAAERETMEEVGIPLLDAEYLGVLSDLQGSPRFRQNRLVVTAHVYHSTFMGSPTLDQLEVASAMWVPVSHLIDPKAHVGYTSPTTGDLEFPGIEVGEPGRHVVWGLTYRFLEIFMEAVGNPLPDRPVVGEMPASWKS